MTATSGWAVSRSTTASRCGCPRSSTTARARRSAPSPPELSPVGDSFSRSSLQRYSPSPPPSCVCGILCPFRGRRFRGLRRRRSPSPPPSCVCGILCPFRGRRFRGLRRRRSPSPPPTVVLRRRAFLAYYALFAVVASEGSADAGPPLRRRRSCAPSSVCGILCSRFRGLRRRRSMPSLQRAPQTPVPSPPPTVVLRRRAFLAYYAFVAVVASEGSADAGPPLRRRRS
jgi:hypothetical protein